MTELIIILLSILGIAGFFLLARPNPPKQENYFVSFLYKHNGNIEYGNATLNGPVVKGRPQIDEIQQSIIDSLQVQVQDLIIMSWKEI